MKSLNFKFLLPIVLAVLIGIVVSFAVQGFISFVSYIESYLRGNNHLLFGLPKSVLLVSGPIIAGIIVAIIFKLASLDRWHGPGVVLLQAGTRRAPGVGSSPDGGGVRAGAIRPRDAHPVLAAGCISSHSNSCFGIIPRVGTDYNNPHFSERNNNNK